MSVVKGHSLLFEGAAHDEHGARLYHHTGNAGRGMCSCGELSQVLPSGTARKAWHRQHKAEVVIRGTARVDWTLVDRVAAVIDPNAFVWGSAHAQREFARTKARQILELISTDRTSEGPS